MTLAPAIAPPTRKWEDRVELDAAASSELREEHHALIPMIWSDGEPADGQVAYVEEQACSSSC
jgi:hypothetical protein